MRYRATLLGATLSLGLSGCFTPRRQFTMPPVPQVAAKPLPQPVIESPPNVETPLPSIDLPELALNPSPEMELPPPKPTPRRKPSPVPASTVPAPATTPEVTEPPATSPTPVPTTPQLSEILTDDRRKQYETEFAGSVSRARASVTRTSGRRLNDTQKLTVERITTFLQQAEESKGKDLVTALEFARRADLLGQDLLKSLH